MIASKIQCNMRDLQKEDALYATMENDLTKSVST